MSGGQQQQQHLVILFAFHFPPENAVGGARPYRFFKYLNKHNYPCHVITAAEQDGRLGDRVHYVPDEGQSGKGTGWQVERAVRKFIMPGVTGVAWSHAAAAKGQEIIRQYPGARVSLVSTYPPLGVLLASMRLSRMAGVPWVADFRDPFPDKPSDKCEKPFHMWMHSRMERIVFRSATRIIANTDAAGLTWQNKFPRRRDHIHVIWNGFDPENRAVPAAFPADRAHRLYSHVGELYAGRTVAPLLESIGRLIANGRIAPGEVRIQLTGHMKGPVLPAPDFTNRAIEAGWLELQTTPVPKKEAERISATSNGLWLIQPQSAVQVPGKLYDYIQLGRPVLAFVPPSSPVERLLSISGIAYRCIYPEMSPETVDELMYEYLRLPCEAREPSAEFEDRFNGERQTLTLERLLDGMH
jgi:hypothetical protein